MRWGNRFVKLPRRLVGLGLFGICLSGFLVPAVATESFDPRRCSRDNLADCLNGVGSGVTSLDTLRIGGERHGRGARSSEEARGEERLAVAGERGVAAGDLLGGGWGFWGSLAYSDYESRVFIAPYEGGTTSVLAGLDRFVGNRLLLGLSLGHERSSIDTFFNGGDQRRDGLTVAPYGLWIVSEWLSVDAAAGYTHLDTRQRRIDPANAATLSADFRSDRAFFTGNLNAMLPAGDWIIGARAGVLHTVESQRAYREQGGPTARSVGRRHVKLTQGHAGLEVARPIGAFEPYAMAIYRYDLAREDGRKAGGLPAGIAPQPADRDEVQLGLGLRYYRGQASAAIEWLRTEGRSRFVNDSFTVNLRADF
jgi:hypothetical protein